VRAVYEAGPTGFGLARLAREQGLQMMVCSPGAIPRQPGDAIKTDTRDALKLARLLAAGQLRPVVVASLELEALRDLVRAREDLRGDLMGARHRISKLLLRRGIVYEHRVATWLTVHRRWLRSVRFDDPLVEAVFGEYLAHHEVLLARRDRLDGLLAEQSLQGPWAPTVARLRCLRGVDTLTAVGLVAEIGDITAFEHPKRLASYLGIVPSEKSSGTRRRQGSITKAAAATRGGCSSRRPGTTVARRGSPTRCDAARLSSRRRRSTRRGARRCGCTAAGRTWMRRARRSARPSRSPWRASSRASSGRLLVNRTETGAIPARFGVGVAVGAASHGTRVRVMSTDPRGRRAR
jgi:transposase